MAFTLNRFRDTYKIVDKNVLKWFPGHMDTGMKKMQRKLTNVDCIIEVHDARIPISGRNLNFKTLLYGIKPHILVLNKKDLTDGSQNIKVKRYIEQTEGIEHVVYTNCKSSTDSGVKRLLPLLCDIINNSNRFQRQNVVERDIMIIGVPNVGKSSLINILRSKHLKKTKATPTGSIAGITKHVTNRIKIFENPPIFMFDTPGILYPEVTNVENGLKLALCACLKDHLVGEDIIADYLLYWLNKYQKFQYVELMGLDNPSDDIYEVLTKGAVKLDKYLKRKTPDNKFKLYPDFIYAAKYMTEKFRTGELGQLFLDRNVIQ